MGSPTWRVDGEKLAQEADEAYLGRARKARMVWHVRSQERVPKGWANHHGHCFEGVEIVT